MYLQEENISRKKKLRLFTAAPVPFSKESVSFMRDLPGFTLDVWREGAPKCGSIYGKPFDLFVYYINVFIIMNNRQKIKTDHMYIFSIPRNLLFINPSVCRLLLKKFLVYQSAAVACRIQHQSLVVKLNSTLSHRT